MLGGNRTNSSVASISSGGVPNPNDSNMVLGAMRDLKIRLVYNYEDTIRTGCHIQARERTHWYTCNLTAFNGTIERIKFTGIPQSSKKKALCSTLSNLYLSLSDDERATAANVHRRRRCNQSLSPVRSINTSNLSRQSGDAQSPVYPGDFTDGDQITSPIINQPRYDHRRTQA